MLLSLCRNKLLLNIIYSRQTRNIYNFIMDGNKYIYYRCTHEAHYTGYQESTISKYISKVSRPQLILIADTNKLSIGSLTIVIVINENERVIQPVQFTLIQFPSEGSQNKCLKGSQPSLTKQRWGEVRRVLKRTKERCSKSPGFQNPQKSVLSC